VTTAPNVPVTFQAVCTDTGPEYEQTEVLEFNNTNPTNGTLTQDLAGDPFTYTPNQGFVGTDSFQVKSFDALGFGSDTGTVTLKVEVPRATTRTTKCKKKKKHKRSADSAKKKKCKKKKKKRK
jgi:Bacterial Ig domain